MKGEPATCRPPANTARSKGICVYLKYFAYWIVIVLYCLKWNIAGIQGDKGDKGESGPQGIHGK